MGILTTAQVEQVLRAQVMWGGRFGTNAVELGFVDLDTLARAIGRLHDLPAALQHHFVDAEHALQARLSPALAAEYGCIPLRTVGPRRVVLASREPLDGRARALVADQLGISYKGLVPAVAAELRIHYQLERVYGVPRDVRFLRARTPSTVPIDRRQYIRTVDDPQPVARIELRPRRPAGSPPPSLRAATTAIRCAADREELGKYVLDTVARYMPAKAALLLVVRGKVAAGWTGFGKTGEPIPQIAVPLDQPGLVPSALRERAITRAPASALALVDAALLNALGVPDAELVVAPIALDTQAWCTLAIAAEHGAPLGELPAIGSAAAAAFARLLRDAQP